VLRSKKENNLLKNYKFLRALLILSMELVTDFYFIFHLHLIFVKVYIYIYIYTIRDIMCPMYLYVNLVLGYSSK
jgi:hypothetical protein